MKVLIRYLIFSVTLVGLAVGCLNIFRAHPEVQFAFLMPGLFILMYSIIRDDMYRRYSSLHLVRGNDGRGTPPKEK
ncbi:hypothetical protein [Mucilaginibacter myungsuensis]|uniref:Lipoprotein n=1 Tax=Mucilaginibacter myungsuensis TaxID=649104 RepID=A0A929L184_9SPHI|nr:hypothetical protein [Mucilaginibacter myungsuensis]MBE9661396.1 hypothetical protein [Mucilaginibacter myungsuensis]MDN3597539.1 hypothetical protein [Mucilaginibacter myungsuensis]